MKEKRIVIALVILTIIFALFGSTFAYWSWQISESQKTNVLFTLENDFMCAADGGGDIALSALAPTTCTNEMYAIQRPITVTPTINKDDLSITTEMWLDINSIDSELTNSENFRYALTNNSNSCTDGVISAGNFKGIGTGEKIRILNKNYSDSSPQTYYLYVWLDAVETSSSTMDRSFNLSISGSCFEQVSPEPPLLDEGMIPVTLSSSGTIKTISPGDEDWYNYEKKEWANVVLVSDESRSVYQDKYDVTVNQNDILAYYTWIPRYKYRIPEGSGEREIDINFESAGDSMKMGDAINTYRTHPAFWWDNDSNGIIDSDETVSGIWVGKFETTGDATKPTILPNSDSLRSQNVNAQFVTSQKFSANGNAYGLNYETTNAHMMKNNEWGAVAYLSHSKYGINDEIRINNSSQTGCGALEKSSASTSSCEIPYNASFTPQSTTGNITGVFDIAGCAMEIVMSVLSDDDGNPISRGSGFTVGVDFPLSKYYDLYDGTSSTNSCNGGICYGHALSETSNWYGDYDGFVNSDGSWLIRGGSSGSAEYAGAFSSDGYYGGPYIGLSWRSVIIVGYGV